MNNFFQIGNDLIVNDPTIDKAGLILNFGGKEYYIHDTVLVLWLIVVVLAFGVYFIGKKVEKQDPLAKPKGVVFFSEMLVSWIDNLVLESMDIRFIKLSPYLVTLVLLIASANLSGLLGIFRAPPTTDYNVTLSLALITLVMIHVSGIKFKGTKGYLKGFLEPLPFMLPLNLMDIVSKPLSMSMRLFANILAGSIITLLLYSLFMGLLGVFSIFVSPIITPALHVYFDLFSGLVQTYVFLMLTVVFIKEAV